MDFGDIGKSLFGGSIAQGIGSVAGSLGDMLYSAKAANRQMDFQQYMSSTAYQRAALDLEKAGLNRILALGSPASSPPGASAAPVNFGSAFAANRQAAVAESVGKENAQLLRDQQLVARSTAAKQVAEAELIKEQTITQGTQRILNTALSALYDVQGKKVPVEMDELRSRIGLQGTQTGYYDALTRKTGAEADQAEVLKAAYDIALPIVEMLKKEIFKSSFSARSIDPKLVPLLQVFQPLGIGKALIRHLYD